MFHSAASALTKAGVRNLFAGVHPHEGPYLGFTRDGIIFRLTAKNKVLSLQVKKGQNFIRVSRDVADAFGGTLAEVYSILS